MSTQPTTMLFGPRLGPVVSDPAGSDLQVLVARVASILSYRRWLFVLPLLTGVLLSLLVSLAIPRRYDLSTIFERRDDVVITKLISSNSPYSFETIRRSLGFDLMGYHALSQAVDDLGLTCDLPRDPQGALTPEGQAAKQQLLAALHECLEVKILEKSTFLDLIQVRYVGRDPELGQRLVSQLRDNYIARTRTYITDILHKSREFFAAEAEKRRQKATTLEAQLMQMSVMHPGVNPADPDLLSQRLTANAMAIDDLQFRRSEAESKIRSFREYLEQLEQHGTTSRPALPGAPAERWVVNPRRERLRAEADQVRTQIADAKMLRQMTDHHPHVVGLREKLERLEAAWAAEPERVPADPSPGTAGPGGTLLADPLATEKQRISAELTSQEELIARIDQNLARLRTERQTLEEDKSKLFERRQKYLMLQQEVQAAKSDLRVWEDHVETVSRVLTAEEGKRGIGFATVEKAQIPSRPSSPTLGGIWLTSGGVGLALGILAVFLREVFDRSFRDPAKVRQVLGIPVLETIGEIPGAERRRLLNGRICLPVLAGVEALLVAATAGLVFLNLQHRDLFERVVSRVLPGQLLTVLGIA